MKRLLRSGAVVLLLLSVLLPGCKSPNPVPDAEPAGAQTVTIAAVGDLFLSDVSIEQARKPDGTYDFLPSLRGMFSAISDTDLTIGNLEGNLNGTPYGPSYGSYPDEFAEALKNGGFDVLQTANSYSIYAGMTGLERTKSIIEGTGMIALGTYVDSADRAENEVRMIEINGIRIALLSFTKSLNGMTLPDNAAGCVDLLYTDYTSDYAQINSEGILYAINLAKQRDADVIIAALHWGSENISTISETQNEIAKLMFSNGVDAIIGSHSHLVSTVERRSVTTEDGIRKDVVLAYSLGDFLDVEAGECNLAPVLKLTFSKSAERGISLDRVTYSTVASVDLGKEAPVRYASLDVENELALYESNYYNCISRSLYDRLTQKRESMIESIGFEPQ